MKALRNYSVKHYYGKDSERPESLPNGDFFYAEDTFILYKYDSSESPIALNSGSSDIDQINDIEELFTIQRDGDGNIVKIISKYDMQVPPQSIEIGESIKVSDLSQSIGYETKFNNKSFILPSYEFDNSGGKNIIVKDIFAPSSFDLQPLFDTSKSFTNSVEFDLISQQNVIGEEYELKISSSQDIRVVVYRMSTNGGEKTLLVDEILKSQDLDIDGCPLILSPKVDFELNSIYKLVFSTENAQITLRGTELPSGNQYGVQKVFSTQFVPYIKRTVGWSYIEKDITHLQYENKRVSLEPFNNSFNKLIVLKEYHKKRIIVSDGSKKIETLLPVLSMDDDGWTCQIVNLTPKMISIGGYKFKNGGSITVAYLADEDKFIHLSFEANGGQLTNPELIQIKDIPSQTYDIIEEDEDYLLNMQFNGNWVANLPNIDDVNDTFKISLIHKQDDNFIGNVVAYGDNLIDGDSNVKMFGQGLITLSKILFDGSYQWFVSNQVSYNTVEMQGKTRRYNFSNQSIIQINHNLGFIPIVQVWVEDGEGGFVEANVDIDHDWDDMNSFEIQLNSPQSGKIIY